jgi:phosphoglycerate dehydrogenase-like enzyme
MCRDRTSPQNSVACTAHRVIESNTTGSVAGGAAPAELALGVLLSAARAIPAADAGIRAVRFQHGVPIGISLAGKTLGIIGLGHLWLDHGR